MNNRVTVIIKILWLVAFIILGAAIRIPHLSKAPVTTSEAIHLVKTIDVIRGAETFESTVPGNLPTTLFHKISAPVIKFFEREEGVFKLRMFRWTTMLYSLLAALAVAGLGLRRRGGLFENEIGLYLALVFSAVSPVLCSMSRMYIPENFVLLMLSCVFISVRAYSQWPSLVPVFSFAGFAGVMVCADIHSFWSLVVLIPSIIIGAGWKRLSLYWRSLHVISALLAFSLFIFIIMGQNALEIFTALQLKFSVTPLLEFIKTRWAARLLPIDIAVTIFVGITFFWSWLRDDRRFARFSSLYLFVMVLASLFFAGAKELFALPITQMSLVLAGLGIGIFAEHVEQKWYKVAIRIGCVILVGGLIAGYLIYSALISCHKSITDVTKISQMVNAIPAVDGTFVPHCLLFTSQDEQSRLLWELREVSGVTAICDIKKIPSGINPACIIINSRDEAEIKLRFPAYVKVAEGKLAFIDSPFQLLIIKGLKHD